MTNQQSLCSEMGGELCFAMQCRGSRQRPALRRECSKCLNKVAYVKDDTKQTSLSPVLPISPWNYPTIFLQKQFLIILSEAIREERSMKCEKYRKKVDE